MTGFFGLGVFMIKNMLLLLFSFLDSDEIEVYH